MDTGITVNNVHELSPCSQISCRQPQSKIKKCGYPDPPSRLSSALFPLHIIIIIHKSSAFLLLMMICRVIWRSKRCGTGTWMESPSPAGVWYQLPWSHKWLSNMADDRLKCHNLIPIIKIAVQSQSVNSAPPATNWSLTFWTLSNDET